MGDSIRSTIYCNPEKAVTLCYEYIKLNKVKNNVKEIASGYAALAISYETMGELDSISYFYYKAPKLYNRSVDSILSTYYIGRIYDNNYKYNKALKSYWKMLELMRKEGKSYYTDYINFSIAIIKSNVEAHKEVPESIIESLEELYEDALSRKDLKQERYLRKKLIEAYLQSNKVDLAKPLIQRGIEQAKTNNNLKFLYYLYSFRGEVETINNNFYLAKKDYEEALKYAEILKNKVFIEHAKYELASIAYVFDNYNEAIKYLKEIELLEAETTIFQKSKNYKLFADTYKAIDSIELSNKYLNKHTKVKEDYSTEYFNLIDKIYEITFSEKVLDLEEGHKKTKWFWIGVSFSLIVLIVVVILYSKKKAKENQKRFNQLMIKTEVFEKNKLQYKEEVKSAKSSKGNSSSKTIKSNTKSEQRPMDASKVQDLLVKLEKLEQTNFFLHKDCTLHSTAKKLKTNTSYLSKIINTHLSKTFVTYINELRINYAVVELKNNKRLRAYSIKAIAEEIGYKNADAFSRYFKAETGISPSVYIKKIKNENF